MTTHKLQKPFTTRTGQFVEGKQTLAVGILESVIMESPPGKQHLLEMGNWIYGQTFDKLRQARERYIKHVWVNARGQRVCILPVLDVFVALKKIKEDAPVKKVEENKQPKLF